MNILRVIAYFSIITSSTILAMTGITVIKKLKLIDDFKEKTENNIKGATDKISTAADKITKVTDRVFKGSD